MVKFNECEGNSCYIYFFLCDVDGILVMVGDGEYGFSFVMEYWIVGIFVMLCEFIFFYVFNINLYKCFVKGSFVLMGVVWGIDNCICVLWVIGLGLGLWVENWVLGGDVNLYFGILVIIVGGLYGIENEFFLFDWFIGNVYEFGVEYLLMILCEVV